MDNWMLFPILQRAGGTYRMSPVCTGNIGPPVKTAREIHGPLGLVEHNGRRHQQLRICAGVVLEVWCPFCKRYVVCLIDKMLPLLVCDSAPVHPETVDCDFVHGTFFFVEIFRTHLECSSGYPDHTQICWLSGFYDCHVGFCTFDGFRVHWSSPGIKRKSSRV